MSEGSFVPYCGQAPVPGELVWNTDPILIGALLGIGAVYALGCRTAQGPTNREQGLFALGLAVTAAALISPLCNLSVALFSARVTQHMVLTLIAAPLIALGRPERALVVLRPRGMQMPAFSRAAIAAGGAAFALAIWTWHLPGPYDATLQNNAVYWAMHITTVGAAVLLWHGLLLHKTEQAGTALIVAFATATQMGLLGAVLTLAPNPLFVVHFATTWPWHLSPLQDQQLGGLIMWVPAGLLFMLYGLAAFADWLNTISAEPT